MTQGKNRILEKQSLKFQLLKMETIIKNLPFLKTPHQCLFIGSFIGEFYQAFKYQIIPFDTVSER